MIRWTLLFVVLLTTAMCVWGWSLESRAHPVLQPLAFNHKRHVAEDMGCKDCHKGVDNSPYATFPKLRKCMMCHEEAKGNSPEEAKIREYAKQGNEIPWIQVNQLPGHVYFSHAAHVKYARLDCAECHGDMKERVEPVTVSQIQHLGMNDCIHCHTEKMVSTDCLRCHK